MFEEKKGLLYIEDANKSIFLYERNVKLLKKLGTVLFEEYPQFQILAFDNLSDYDDFLIKERPSLLIMELSFSNHEEVFEIIKKIKLEPLNKNTPIIVMGNRDDLETYSREIKNFDLQIIPKSIRIPFFISVVQSTLSQSSSMEIDLIRIKKGELLFEQGDKAREFFILKKGQLEVFQNHDGEDFILGKILEGEIVGEMGFIQNTPRTGSVKALKDSEVLRIHLHDFNFYMESQPFWLNMMLKALINRLGEANKLKTLIK